MKAGIIIFILTSFFSMTDSAAALEAIENEEVIVRYEEGLDGVSREIVRLIPSLRNEIEERTGLLFDFPFEAMIYQDRDAFSRLVDHNDMIAAFAVPGRDLIVLDYSYFRHDSMALKLIVMHEMCHLLLHKNISGDNLPRWFDEGVSQWVSSGINEIIYPRSKDILRRAVISNEVIPFSEISADLPSDRFKLILSYEQSRSMVDYIEQSFGKDAIKRILLELKKGSGFHEALSRVSGTDLSEIEKRWRRVKGEQYTWLSYLSNHLYMILFFFAAFLTIAGYFGLRKRMREYQDDEE